MENKVKFVPENTDYNLSPYTWLTRESWIEAGKYLLTGIFSHISSKDSSVVMPRIVPEVTFPLRNAVGKHRKL